MNWRKAVVGVEVRYSWYDFDGSGSAVGVVVEVASDHVIVRANGMSLWVDDSNAEMFEEV